MPSNESLHHRQLLRPTGRGKSTSIECTAQLRGVNSSNSQQPPTNILALPSEILSIVFFQGQLMDKLEPAWPDMPFEILVSHVCSYFRDVAIGTRSLWTSIRLYSGVAAQRIATYVERSELCLLDVQIELTECASGESALSAVFAFVLIHSWRWRSFSIRAIESTVDHPIFHALCGLYMPTLQHLSVMMNDADQAADSTAIVDRHYPIHTPPTLNTLRLRGVALFLFQPLLTKLTTLHIDHTKSLPLSLKAFQSIVTASPSLRNLSIYGEVIDATGWSGESIVLGTLETLRVCGISNAIYSGLLVHINAPKLQSLTIKDAQEDDLSNFLSSHTHNPRFPHLSSLTLCEFNLSAATYRHLFATFPFISSFALISTSSESSLVLTLLGESIVSGEGKLSVWWPSLETLTALLNFQDERMLDNLVRARQQNGKPLRALRMGVTRELIQSLHDDWLHRGTSLDSFSDLGPWLVDCNTHDPDDDLFF
ncbi:hypothetical protein AX16_005209 [Volvariella volvacea WC 439]|nr:hypothetical protein AX16_005209 [Volvariella volvacea WC 439]